MKKKTKIIISVILLIIVAIASVLIGLTLNVTSHAMKLNKPDYIVIYHNSSSTNKVFYSDTDEYNDIYKKIISAFEQPIITAIANGKIFKDVKIVKTETKEVEFDEIKVEFVYENPQTVKYKNKMYTNNNQVCWYQGLIFNILEVDKYQYNTVAIIPENNQYDYNYELYYNAYSNFSKTYKACEALFK